MSHTGTRSKARAQSRKTPNRNAARTGPFLTGKSLNIILCILLAGVTVAIYSPVFGNSFVVYDDQGYVTGNSHIQQGLAWSTVKWAFTTTQEENWHPLTWLSHALDYQLFALNPAGHHLDSLVIHVLNAVLLFLVLAWATKRVGPSLLVAALFALHPINVESVAWVAQRKNVLSTFFFLLAITAYVWYARRPDWQRYVLVAALFAAGLMAKPSVITLPFVLLLLDYWPLGRMAVGTPSVTAEPQFAVSRLLLEKIPLLVFSAASALITIKAQRSGIVAHSVFRFSLTARIENAVVSYGLYLWKMLWPARLAALYPYPANALPMKQVILSALILAGITTLVAVFHRKRYLLVGWFWFLGTLIPVIGLVQIVGNSVMADRYAYVPLIGIFVMIAWGLDDWAKAKKIRDVWLVITALCVLAVFGFVTNRQIGYWENKYTLWRHAVEVTEENSFAHGAMASALMDPAFAMTANRVDGLGTEQQRLDEARRQYEEALKIHRQRVQHDPNNYMPQFAMTLNEIGILDAKQNRTDDARRYYEEALLRYQELARRNPNIYSPDVAMTLNNLGNLDRLQNRTEEARQHLEGALEVYRQLAQQNPNAYLPERATMLSKLAVVDRIQNRMDDARGRYEEAAKIQRRLAEQNPAVYLPDLAKTLGNFGLLDAIENRMDEARGHYEEALKIHRQLAEQNPAADEPGMAMTLSNLGRVDQLQNRIDDARAHYQEALSLLRKLSQGDSRYAGEVDRVRANLEELEKKASSR